MNISYFKVSFKKDKIVLSIDLSRGIREYPLTLMYMDQVWRSYLRVEVNGEYRVYYQKSDGANTSSWGTDPKDAS